MSESREPLHDWWTRRRESFVEEVRRARAGGHAVPTWVLAVVLVVIVAAWLTLVLVA